MTNFEIIIINLLNEGEKTNMRMYLFGLKMLRLGFLVLIVSFEIFK